MGETLQLRYLPGHAIAFAGRRVAVLANLASDHVLVDRVLEVVENDGDADDALDALVSSGVRAVPDFAVAELTADGFRVLVRGSFTVVPDEGQPILGVPGAWSDARVPTGGLHLCTGASLPGRSMPFAGGVVLADELVVSNAGLDPAQARPMVARPVAPVVDQSADAEQPAEVLEEASVLETEPSTPAPDFDFLFAATGMRPSPPPEVEIDLPRLEEPRLEVSVPKAREVSETTPAYLTRTADSAARSPEGPPIAVEPSAPGGMITGMPWMGAAPQEFESVPIALPPREEPPAAGLAFSSTPTYEAPHSRSEALPDLVASVDRTISRAQLRGHGPVAPTVVAARCPVGHLSPAYAGVCRVCHEPLPSQQPFETPRPTLGILRLSTGGVVTLDRGAIIGRNPKIPSGFRGREQPNLVQVVDPEKDVSSQHLEITLDFWNVMVRDLDSTNGTEVVLPGEMPVTLRADVPQILEPGSKVVMGGSVSFTFEVTA